MKFISVLIPIAICLLLMGCDQPVPAAGVKRPPLKQPPPAPLKSWDEFQFGMSFDDASAAASGITWEGMSLRDCIDKLPIRGCRLQADPESSYREAIAGMQLLPNLEFNQNGRLTDVDMTRQYRAGVDAAQCEAIHVRLLDYLTKRFGAALPVKSEGVTVKRSPAGNIYHIGSPGPVIVAGFEKFRTASDGSNIALTTVFYAKSEYTDARCQPSMDVQGPKSLTRSPIPVFDKKDE